MWLADAIRAKEARLRVLWTSRLGYQMAALPEFDEVFRAVQRKKYKVSLRLSAVNLTNHVALYNFLSTFSGTHYVTPRALTATVGWHF
jgi:hypothetical protein